MKKWDKIIIIALLVISFVPYAFFKFFAVRDYNTTYAYVTVGGQFYKEIPLGNHKGKSEYVIDTDYGKNKLILEDDKIAVIDADCPDKICTQLGFASKPGESLVCLPHKLYVEVRGEVKEEKETKDSNEIDVKAY